MDLRTHIPVSSLLSILMLTACGASESSPGIVPAASKTTFADASSPSGGSSGAASGSDSSSVAGAPDPCAGVTVTTKQLVSYSPLAKPAKGQALTDPDFGVTIRRITDAKADWNMNVVVPAYPTIAAWNADESLLLLYATAPQPGSSSSAGWALFNGKTYAFKQWLPIRPADIEQFYWDTKNPDVLYYVDRQLMELTRYHVSSGARDTVHDFAKDVKGSGLLASACSGVWHVGGGEDPFSMSQNNDLIGLGCALTSKGRNGATNFAGFSYRLSTGAIGSPITAEAVVPQATPSGRHTLYYGLTSGRSEQVLDPLTNQEIRTVKLNGAEHGDMLVNAAGQDIVAMAQYDGPSGDGSLMIGNLDTGEVSTIIGKAKGDPYPPSGTLISGRAYKVPGWVVVSTTGRIRLTQTYLDQEVLLANVDTNKICRLAHHRSTGNWDDAKQSNYWAQPNATPSPRGTRVLFASDWGAATPGNSVDANPNATIDTYVIELPSYAPDGAR